jgi:primosomal protein N' (replication factor Y)
MSEYIQVAVNAPLTSPLTYSFNTDLASQAHRITRGASVQVPLGQRMAHGVVLGFTEDAPSFEIKPIDKILEERPVLSDAYLRWIEWLARYYLHPVGKVLASTFPPLKKQTTARASKASPVVPVLEQSDKMQLTIEQTTCLQQLLLHETFQASLLHGVTGSGKTEVYLQLLEKTLAAGKGALVLVPEISLTPQLIQRFAARFQDQIAVIHSHLTEREKTNQWWSVVNGEKRILIGARSALFCPMQDLGVIIVDEEHEPSFKQEEQLKYHARDAAVMLAKMHDCSIVLGSATPSLESWQNAKAGRYQYLQMTNRVNNRPMPTTTIVDLKKQKEFLRSPLRQENTNDRPFWLSEELHIALTENRKAGFQSALFLNRRGMAQMALCTSCGTSFECPNCAISLTLHGQRHLVCHYCDYSQQLAENCPHCQAPDIEKIGLGTELVEKDILRLFPEARVARADRDEISNRKDLEALIREMESGEIDILVGTQMIAKGLDFPRLTLVGLVLADVGFNLPDFRATERSFQLLTQVSGRAGRHRADGGKVIVQTFNPEHPSLVYAVNNDYVGFAESELMERQDLGYPPAGRLVLFRLVANQLEKVERLSLLVANRAEQLRASMNKYEQVQILGPCPAPLAKIRNNYRYQLLLKCADSQALQSFCYQLLGDQKWVPSGTKVQADVDPVSML